MQNPQAIAGDESHTLQKGYKRSGSSLNACKQSIINDQGMRSAGRKGLSVSVRGLRVRMSPAGMAESQPGMQCWSLKSSKLFLFCPSNLTAPNKSHNPPLVIPSGPGFPTSLHYPGPRMRLSVESRMKSTEATVFDRNPGQPSCSAPRLPRKGLRSVSSPTNSSSLSGAPHRLIA
jgi:hypothetical protein